MLACEVGIQIKRVLHMLRTPLGVLRNITLHQRYTQGRAARLGPVDLRQQRAGEPEHAESGKGGVPCTSSGQNEQCEQSGGERHRKRHAVHSGNRREATQWRIDLTVTKIEPGKSRQDPATAPLNERPGGREQQCQTQLIRATQKTCRQVAEQHREQRQHAHEQRAEQYRERHAGMTEVVNRNIHPRHTDTELAEAI